MKIKLILLLILLNGVSTHAATFFEQLVAFNPNWKNYEAFVPRKESVWFRSDREYIQIHLENVLRVLNAADVSGLNNEQQKSRVRLMNILSRYRAEGTFPLNFYKTERIPVFIDELGTHCAVGFLMKESGYGHLALEIASEDNYIWVKDIQKREVLEWQQKSGFTLEELKLIQGAYDSYMPYALEAINRIEIPQKPDVIMRYFEGKDLATLNSKFTNKAIWIKGEGTNGVLNGRWEQNYSPELPWIVGHYKDGKRSGRWLEYFRGTNKLCRTEYWENDKLNGIRTRFDQSGNVIERIQFKDGKAILKTNYEASTHLKYVRKPLDDNKLYTEVYDMLGALVAKGTELISNRGNLQWFQNIELTALNTMSIASQSYNNGNISSSEEINYYDSPPLVDYIKQNDWVYYTDFNENDVVMDAELPAYQLFAQRFYRFGPELYYATRQLGEQAVIPEYDSISVNYINGEVNGFDGFYRGETISRYRFEWFPSIWATNFYRLDYSQFTWYVPMIKTYGQVNEKEEKIGKWCVFNENGLMVKTEEFIIPEKRQLIEME